MEKTEGESIDMNFLFDGFYEELHFRVQSE